MRRLITVLLALTPACELIAQARSARTCEGMPVSVVSVDPQRPDFHGPMKWWRATARALGLHHETTADGIVRRFVTLDPGLPCTDFRRAESERILRAQPFLANATVRTRRLNDSIRVDVTTVDEVPVVAAARFGGSALRAVSLGTLNLLGVGMHVEGNWEQGRALRDGYGLKLAHYQLFGKPFVVAAEGAIRPLGESYSTSFSHPLLTDLQRTAWYSGFGITKDFVALRRPDRTELLQPLNRGTWNVGGVLRIGPPRRLFLLGGMLMGDRLVPRTQIVLRDSLTGGVLSTVDTAGIGSYPTIDETMVAGVWGVRALSFSKMAGLDALEAEQDVGTGTQLGAIVGANPKSPSFRDAFASVDAYVGGRTAHHFVGARAQVESRFDRDRGTTRHVVGSGRAAWYFSSGRWLSELSVEGAGVARAMIPFQLALGDRESGVRGYARADEVGGQRVVGRLEERWNLGRIRQGMAAYGVAAFVDAGRIWAGDAPFGTDTPLRTSIGASLVAAVPARSQRTIRAELAVPMRRAEGARPEFRFVIREPLRGFWREPNRVRWARLTAAPEQVFSWP